MDREVVGIVIATLVAIATWEATRWTLRLFPRLAKSAIRIIVRQQKGPT